MMEKHRVKVIAVVVLVFAVLFEIGYIIRLNLINKVNMNSGETAQQGEVLSAPKLYKINNNSIPAYVINGIDGTYFTNIDLKLFGFNCDLSGSEYILSYDSEDFAISSDSFVQDLEGELAAEAEHSFIIGKNIYACYIAKENVLLIPEVILAGLGEKQKSEATNTVYYAFGSEEVRAESRRITETEIAVAEGRQPVYEETDTNSKIIVIDPGHGKSSSLMSTEEKLASGWIQNSSGNWGEWRHYKTGSSTENCEASGCNGRVTPNGACWYPIGNSDRNVEPELNLNNALAAKKYLEEMGYTVRLTRQSNDENPSITRRLSYCHPDNDTTKAPDAELFLCIHSNASGGHASGTAYISAEGQYDQKWITDSYVEDSNRLGNLCNDSIVNNTSIRLHGNGIISFEPELIAFCKSPVPCGYLEIGFFDNKSELATMQAECDRIGKAIALGIDQYFEEN